MDFCLKVGSEVETLFRAILNDKKFNNSQDIETDRKNQNIKVYRKYIEPKYRLSKYNVVVNPIKLEIQPFENFGKEKYPIWFRIYSKHKHNKIELIKNWNLIHSLYALGCLLLLVINHPSLDGKAFSRNTISQRVFNLGSSHPRYVESIAYLTIGK